MSTATLLHKLETFTNDEVICYDCRTRPQDGHFTVVPPSNRGRVYDTLALGPELQRLYADYVCDPCFLRRRLEGRL